MPIFYEISIWCGTDLTKASFASFMEAVAQRVTTESEELNETLKTAIEQFKKQVTAFSGNIKRRTNFDETQEIARRDNARDNVFKAMYHMTMFLQNSDASSSLQAPAHHVYNLLKTYKGTPRRGLTEGTVEFNGLYRDLNATEAVKKDVEALGLTKLIEELKKENDMVSELLKIREKHQAERLKNNLETEYETNRKQLAEAYTMVVKTLNALNILGGTEETNGMAIDINGIVDHYKKVASQSKKQKKDEKPEDNGQKPSTDKPGTDKPVTEVRPEEEKPGETDKVPGTDVPGTDTPVTEVKPEK